MQELDGLAGKFVWYNEVQREMWGRREHQWYANINKDLKYNFLGVRDYKVVLLWDMVFLEDSQVSIRVRKLRGHSDKTLG